MPRPATHAKPLPYAPTRQHPSTPNPAPPLNLWHNFTHKNQGEDDLLRIVDVLPPGDFMAVYVDADDGKVTRIRLIGWCVYEEDGDLYTVGMLPSDEDGYMLLATPPPEEHLFIDYASAEEWEQEQHHYNQEAARLLAEHEGVLGEEDEDDGGE